MSLLLDLRSALCGIPASSGFAHHFESRFRPQRLTSVGRFFLCVCVRARVLTDLWFSVIVHFSASTDAPSPQTTAPQFWRYMVTHKRIAHLGRRVAGIESVYCSTASAPRCIPASSGQALTSNPLQTSVFLVNLCKLIICRGFSFQPTSLPVPPQQV